MPHRLAPILSAVVLVAGCAPPTGERSSAGWPILDNTYDASSASAHRRALALGDLDGDGALDVATAGNDGDPSQILAWNGTNLLVVDTLIGDATDVCWGDLDGDGDLDLVVARGGAYTAPNPDTLYRNDGGSLVWWSELDDVDTHAAALADWDGDGDLDLARAIDGGPHDVWENDGDGGFTPAWASTELGVGMAVAWVDADGDGDPDLSIARLGDTQLIYENTGGDLDLAFESGSALQGYGVAWADRDLDGVLEPAWALGTPDFTTFWSHDGSFGFAGDFTVSGSRIVRALAFGADDGDAAPDVALAVQDGASQVARLVNDAVNTTLTLDDAGDTTWDVAWGDLDGDAQLDLLTANDGGPVRVFRSGFQPWREGWYSAETADSNQIAVGDMDGDGDPDVAVSTGDGNTAAPFYDRVYQSVGDELVLYWTSPTVTTSYTVAWGDVDGDGDLDLVFAGTSCVVWENTGTGFSVLWTSPAGGATEVLLGDVDGDGDLDLFQYPGGVNTARIFLNDGEGDFVQGWSSADHTWGLSAAFGDRDGDGDLDLALGRYQQVTRVLDNDGAGNFTLAWSSPSAAQVESISWLDGDGDGDLDLLVSGPPTPVFYRNNGAGFDPVAIGSGALNSRRAAPFDWDGDGDLDFVVASWSASDQLWLNDGTGSFGRVWSSQSLLGTQSAEPLDLQHDGDIDLVLATSDDDPHRAWFNRRFDVKRLPNEPTRVVIDSPGVTAAPNWGPGVAEVLIGPSVPVVFTVLDEEYDAAPSVEMEYSLVGGGSWSPATILGATTDLSASPEGVQHTVQWELAADGAEGDMLALRISIPHQSPRFIASPVQEGRLAATSGWFRAYPACFPLDADRDGARCEDDCDEDDPDIHPGATELADDGVDQDCNGVDLLTCYQDGDGDGVGGSGQVLEADDGDCDDDVGQSSTTGDCDDGDPLRFPGNPEVCDGVDNDCGGGPIPDELDDDGDGLAECAGDCNDASGLVSPALPEACDDGLDNDCDPGTPDVFDADSDGSD